VDAQAMVERELPGLDSKLVPTAERLVETILGALPGAQHERKWGQLTFTRDGDWHHWICAVSPTKEAVKLVVHKGAMLADPQGVMQGKGRYVRAIPFHGPDEIDPDIVEPILREAAERQTEMLPGGSA
jgi:hypothetical protein